MENYSGNTAYAHNTALNPSYASSQMTAQIQQDALAGLKYDPIQMMLYDGKKAQDRRFNTQEIADAVRASMQEKTPIIALFEQKTKRTDVRVDTRRAA